MGKKIREFGICAGCKEERPLVLLVPAWGVLCEECAATPEEEDPTPTTEQARIAALEGALREAERALRPFADLYLSAGDMMERADRPHYEDAYRARCVAAAALGEEEGR